MIAIKRLICITIVATALATSGCASLKSGNSKPLIVTGVDTSNVQLIENDNGKTAVLIGAVSLYLDREAVEEHVRNKFNYEKIVNHITYR